MQATAFLIGHCEKCFEGLLNTSLDIGFSTILNYSNISLAEKQIKRSPLCFFLFSLDSEQEKIPEIAKAIRFNKNPGIRYAPMIGFSENANPKVIKACLQFGFDDIIVSPFDVGAIMLRLNALLNRQITFYETKTYFGPDRRNRELIDNKRDILHPQRGDGGDHRVIIINRNDEIGISVISDEFHKKQIGEDSKEEPTLEEDAKALFDEEQEKGKALG